MEKSHSPSKGLKGGMVLLLLGLSIGCSSTTSNLSADISNPPGNTAVILGSNFTDPTGSLSLVSLDAAHTVTTSLQTTGPDAVLRAFDGKLYVVNRLGQDNIQVINPSKGFAVDLQFSVGNGTNPQEIVVTQPTKAYITLYQPEDNTSADLTVDDVITVDPTTGAIKGTIDLTPYTADDGDRKARASAMIVVNNQIFVALQDLPSNLALPPDQPGKVVAIDTKTDTVTGVVTLQGKNPSDMVFSPQTGMIYVSEADFNDPTSATEGVEVIDPTSLKSSGFLVTSSTLGGSTGDIEVYGSTGYVTVGSFDTATSTFITKIDSFSLDSSPSAAPTQIYQSNAYLQDMAVSSDGLLLIGDRAPATSGVVIYDTSKAAVIAGPINTGPAPSSITFIDL